MNLEKEVIDHGNRLNTVERDIAEVKKDLNDGLDCVDQSNQYLREQNRAILKEVIKRNNNANQHDFENKKMAKTNQFKMFGMILGASGLTFGLNELLLKSIK